MPPRGISGKVTYKGAPISNIKVQLESCYFSLPCEAVLTTTTDINGLYVFPYARDDYLYSYRVTYRNGAAGGNPDDPRYLLYWQSRNPDFYTYAARVSGGDFDIAEVELVSPSNNATVAVPATFTWKERLDGDKYQWFIDAVGDAFGQCDQQDPGTNTSFTFASLGCGGIFTIETGTPHIWRVEVTREGENGGIGQSHVRVVQFAP
ncbi:MAG: carboxypeptidase regulatory-like domain-containing protein [Anaerolineae bacterium]|nr:carboxypeptidase regulatory-like domain-containing protein [Anaerolineae bacterium]